MTELTSALATRATHVIFFEDRAQVERVITLHDLTPGHHALTLGGITSLIDDPSLTVTIASDTPGAASVLTSRVRRRVIERTTGDPGTLDALQERERVARAALAAAEQRAARATLASTHHARLEESLLTQLAAVHPTEPCAPESWREALSQLEARATQARQESAEAQRAMDEARRELTRTVDRLTQALTPARELEALAEVQLEVITPGAITLTLRYITPCALWRPAHRARLTRATPNAPAQVTIETLATVWQLTSERWDGVTCAFSTARPTQSAAPPLLSDDTLWSRAKTDHERQVIDVSAREVTIATSGERGARAVEEMPGVDDGGEPLLFHAASKLTVMSTGAPVTVSLFEVALPCVVDVVAMPEKSPVAHLRARTTWRHSAPLLAGPATLLRERELAGMASLPFTAPGDALTLGFGAESSLRIRREVEVKEIPKKLTRRRHERRTITLHVSNLSDQTRKLGLIERIPVSELEQVVIHLIESEGASPDQDGIVTLSASLGPHQTTRHTIAYELDLDPKVSLEL